MTRHLLTIIFPSGLTVIIVQTCLGEKPRARPDAPSWARFRPPRETLSRCGPKPGGRSAEGARGAVASLLCSRGGVGRGGDDGAAWTRRAGGFGEGSRQGGLCVSALLSSHFGDGEAARPQIAGRASALLRLAGWAGRRRGAQTGFPRRAPSSPGPAPSERASGCPRPAPPPPAPPDRAALQPRAPPRPWLRGRDGCAHVCPRPLARLSPLSATGAPGSGLRGPARRYSPRRRIVPNEEAARERPRASSARGCHLVAAVLPRTLPGLCAEEGDVSGGAAGGAWPCASPEAMQLPRESSSSESQGSSGNCKARGDGREEGTIVGPAGHEPPPRASVPLILSVTHIHPQKLP